MGCWATLSGFLSIILMVLTGASCERGDSGDGGVSNGAKGLLGLMEEHGVDAYLTLMSDEHLNEYVGEGDGRVKFLTGFSGSNGIAVTCKAPVLYTDSRYYIQAEREAPGYKLKRMGEDEEIPEYLEQVGCKQAGICKRLIGSKKYEELKSKLKSRGIGLKAVEDDLVDLVWRDKPKRVFNEVYSIEKEKFRGYQKELAGLSKDDRHRNELEDRMVVDGVSVVGKTYKDKLSLVRGLIDAGQTLVITELDTIAWMFNLRGSDIPYNPVFYSYAIVSGDSAKLFVGGEKWEMEGVEIHGYEDFERHAMAIEGKVVVSGECNAHVKGVFKSVERSSKIRLLQSQKGDIEIEGFRLSYVFDGMALTELFEWIDLSLEKGISESDVAEKLEEIKGRFSGYVQPSFGSIVGGGPNGAVVHHKAGSRRLLRDEIILIDSGSQYMFGTTDTTRTLHFGAPSSEEKESYTRVLKGQLRAMRARFGSRMPASTLDSLSRMDLWSKKLDYGHATGHGVGHFLCVHESPPSVSYLNESPLKPGQVFSIEPGFYKEGEYGIRIENLVHLKDAGDKFYELENLTLVPYHLKLVDMSMMDDEEISYFNKVNSKIRAALEPLMRGGVGYRYLMENTMSINK